MADIALRIASVERAVPRLARQRLDFEHHVLKTQGLEPLDKDWPAEVHELLGQSATLFDSFLAIATLAEAIQAAAPKALPEFKARANEIHSHALALAGLDPVKVLAAQPGLAFAMNRHVVSEEEADRSLANIPALLLNVVRQAKVMLDTCPIRLLEDRAIASHDEALGHRIRVSYDRLSAFVRRNDPEADATLRALGPAYATGRLTLPEIARALRLPPEDIADRLERMGFFRGVPALLLSEEARADALNRIRQDRLGRTRLLPPNESLIRREVIATQRIEDVDARPWLPAPQA